MLNIEVGTEVIRLAPSGRGYVGLIRKISKVLKSGRLRIEGSDLMMRPVQLRDDGIAYISQINGGYNTVVFEVVNDTVRAKMAAQLQFQANVKTIKTEIMRLEALIQDRDFETIATAAKVLNDE